MIELYKMVIEEGRKMLTENGYDIEDNVNVKNPLDFIISPYKMILIITGNMQKIHILTQQPVN